MKPAEKRGFNIPFLNTIHKEILDVTYLCNMDQEVRHLNQIPTIRYWEFVSFDEYKMIIKVNFTDPLYVSSTEDKDELSIVLLDPFYF